MGKQEYIQMGRNDGLAFAWRLYCEEGPEGLEREVNARGVAGVNIKVSQKELKRASFAIKEQTVDTVLMCTLLTLRDEFNYGGKRLKRFRDRFMNNMECLIDGHLTLDDAKADIEEKCKVKGLTLRWNDTDQPVKGI